MARRRGPGRVARALAHLAAFEPAMVRGIVTQVVAALAIWGVSATALGDQVSMTYALLWPIVGVFQAWITRRAVVPVAHHQRVMHALETQDGER